MFTNRKLYTLYPKSFENNIIDQEKLIVNKIDIDFLSHIIFKPKFGLESYELIDIQKLMHQSKDKKPNLIKELK
jgi:hypothetical protein